MCSEAIVRYSECNRNFLTKGVPSTLGSNKLCSTHSKVYELWSIDWMAAILKYMKVLLPLAVQLCFLTHTTVHTCKVVY